MADKQHLNAKVVVVSSTRNQRLQSNTHRTGGLDKTRKDILSIIIPPAAKRRETREGGKETVLCFVMRRQVYSAFALFF